MITSARNRESQTLFPNKKNPARSGKPGGHREERQAEFLHHEVPGITIPQEIRDRMKGAGEKGIEEGALITKEFLEKIKGIISGAYLIPSFGKVELALEVVEEISF